MDLDYYSKKFDQLTSKELYDLLWLRQWVFVLEQSCLYLDADGKDLYAHHVLGYNDHGILLAYSRILEDPKWPGHTSVGRVCTHPNYRGKGLGRSLMYFSLKKAYKLYPQQDIRISAQTYLIDFYNSFGFKQVDGIYDDDGILHQDMLLHFE